ncbi:hypothetical protein LSH36_716g01120 [Paralvinella palmiformis]|uniref:Uncharacterized protein n=1 Tax=Paralvinella palmiformis TaxID=53620 RepID=A0AAD9J1Q9_9ANNE|nr:hypothetical protein LSH36_716g01120 [Paralvinella palmiformis]
MNLMNAKLVTAWEIKSMEQSGLCTSIDIQMFLNPTKSADIFANCLHQLEVFCVSIPLVKAATTKPAKM